MQHDYILKKRKRYGLAVLIVLIILILFPLWMWMAWLLSGKKEMNVLIVDKTVWDKKAIEHRSFNWILNQRKISRRDGKMYNRNADYYGFFPGENHQYKIRDFEKLTADQIAQICDENDMAYFTDTYGVYYNEWYRDMPLLEHSEKIYGGLTKKEVQVLRKLKEQNKLILAEFNFVGSPTQPYVRMEAEDLFHFRWSGWHARYFGSLDTNNAELPRWVVRQYLASHNTNVWPFSKAGIVFVHETSFVEILEDGKDLVDPMPKLKTTSASQEKFDTDPEMRWPYWMDIVYSDATNKMYSYYKIYPNSRGDSILKSHGLPDGFPAVLAHEGNDYTFYYFAGDFADNPVKTTTSKFAGIRLFRSFMYDGRDELDRKKFFWAMYNPMVSTILDNYYERLEDEGRTEHNNSRQNENEKTAAAPAALKSNSPKIAEEK